MQVPVQIEFFEANDEKYRIARALKVDTVDGFPTVMEASMENLKTGSKTVMRYNQVTYNIGVPDEVFSERFMRAPPKEYLR